MPRRIESGVSNLRQGVSNLRHPRDAIPGGCGRAQVLLLGGRMLSHVTLVVRGRNTFARTLAERRATVRTLARIGDGALMLFNVVDDHIHTVLRNPSPRRLARDLRAGLKALRADLRLKPPHLEEVDSRAYLRSLVRYVFQQSAKDGLGADALWDGSSYLDLCGARRVPALVPGAILEELPRLRLREVFPMVGLPSAPLGKVSVEGLGAARLRAVAAAVCCADPSLASKRPEDVRGRRLAIALAVEAGLPVQSLGLSCSPATLYRLRAQGVDPLDRRAAGLRLALEEAAGGTSSP